MMMLRLAGLLWIVPLAQAWMPRSVSPRVATSQHSSLGRIRDSLLNRERSREDLKVGIAGFYDRSSKLWEDVWGEHMHHGYVAGML